MSYSSRIFFYGPVGALLLLVVLYSVFWRVQADTLAARLDRANGGEVIPGLVFAFAEKSVGGYPFRLDVVLSGVTFSHPAPEGETNWRAEKIALHAQSYDQTHYLLETTGLQSVAFPPATPGAPPRIVDVTPGLARASAILVGGKLARFDIDLVEVQSRDASANADGKRNLTASRAQLHLLARADNTIDMAARIDNAKIGAGLAGGANGLELPLIDLRAKLTKAEALDGLREGVAGIADTLAAWRTAAGAIAVSDLSIHWPDAHADLTGDVALDADGYAGGTLKGERVSNDQKTSPYGLTFAKGAIRVSSASALGRRRP